MRIFLAAALLGSATSLAAETSADPAPILTSADAKDVWTRAVPETARVTHVGLDLEIDNNLRIIIISGRAARNYRNRP
jgi:leukotriene-A4 hydrolase